MRISLGIKLFAGLGLIAAGIALLFILGNNAHADPLISRPLILAPQTTYELYQERQNEWRPDKYAAPPKSPPSVLEEYAHTAGNIGIDQIGIVSIIPRKKSILTLTIKLNN